MNTPSNKSVNLIRLHTQRPRDSIAAMQRAIAQYHVDIERAEIRLGQTIKDIAAASDAGASAEESSQPADSAPNEHGAEQSA